MRRRFFNKEYADQFLQGKIYANRLSAFKGMEPDLARGDEYEGGTMLDPSGVKMILQREGTGTDEGQRIVLNEHNLGSSIKMRLPDFDHLNLFCMYGIRLGDLVIAPENTDAIKEQVSLSEKFYDFGGHVVVINNATKFINRVVEAANRKKYGLEFDFITYYDPEVGTTLMPGTIETVFAKRKEYEWQKEFRFAFRTFTQGTDALVLDIGRIDDIAVMWNTSDMINPSIMILKNDK